MNAKRWIAVGMALVLLTISASISGVTKSIYPYQGKGLMQQFFSEDMTETIIYTGKSSQRIAVIFVDGVISSYVPSGSLSFEGYNHGSVLRQIEEIKNDESVQGVILWVNSPGGGTYESAQLKDALVDLKESCDIPLYVSMQNVAASGGYYISAYGDKIFASEETLTGSIGVIMSGRNLSGLYEKLGITQDTIKSGTFKDMGSEARPMTPEDRQLFQEMIDLSYDRFVKVVAEGRKMDIVQVKTVADGRVMDGAQAKEKGLIDEIGYFEDVINALETDNDLPDSEVFYFETNKTPFSSLLGMDIRHLIKKSESQAVILERLLLSDEKNSRLPMYLYRGGQYE